MPLKYPFRTLRLRSVKQAALTPFFLLFILLSLFSSNPFESALGVITLWLISLFFWKRFFVCTLGYCLLWHWMEIYTSVWESNYYRLTMNENFPGTGQNTAFLAGLGLISIIFALQLTTSRISLSISREKLYESAARINFFRLFVLYVFFFIIEFILSQIAFRFPLITQLLLHFGNLKLVFFILIGFVTFIKRKYYAFFLFVSFLEFVSGFYSYFSDFKIVFIVVGVTFLITVESLKFSRVLGLSLLVSLAFISLFYWQMIKGEYRAFLSQGQHDLVVRTGFSESLNEIYRLLGEVDQSEFDATIKIAFRRLGYLRFFSETLDRVPSVIPHENGKLFWENFNFAFVPRFINPNKGEKDDRRKLEKYLGYRFWTKSSISMSYYSEAYIDFGPVGMMFFLFSFGLIIGRLFTYIISLSSQLNLLLVYAMSFVVLLPFASYGADAISIFGRLFWGAIAHLLIFWPAYKFFNRYITAE